MSDIAIKVENLSKLYKLGEVSTGSLVDDVRRWWALRNGKEDPFAQVAQANDRSRKAQSEYVWSLKDISFEVNRGDAVGIIGRNGAGKSTLLKILSRITSPTTGRIAINGRVASLLEVGTGFNPQLTGRENVFMNGAILGMTREEVRRKLDEIIDFSGVEGYIDTPVKRYSSGMYVRLAFAVAAHLDPEILIVDEVLAVGDSEFQRKCLGKMQDVNSKEGRTVLFVSHNMNAVNRLCNKGIIIKNGSMVFAGGIEQAVEEYTRIDSSATLAKITYDSQPDKDISLSYAQVTTDSGEVIDKPIDINTSFNIEFGLYIKNPIRKPHITFHLRNSRDECVLFSDRQDDDAALLPTEAGVYNFRIRIPQPLLKPDHYHLSIGLVNHDNEQTNHFRSIIKFEIQDLVNKRVSRSGYIFMPFKWEIEKHA